MNLLDVSLLEVRKIFDAWVSDIFCSLPCLGLAGAWWANLFTYQSQEPCQNFSRTLPNSVSMALRSMYPDFFFERLTHPLNKYLARRRKNYRSEILWAVLDKVLDGFTLLFFPCSSLSTYSSKPSGNRNTHTSQSGSPNTVEFLWES